MNQRRFHKGKFTPKNPTKYIGTLPIIYRSLWELAVMKFFDESVDVVKWGSESIVIPYVFEKDNKVHRYFVDFNYVDRNGRKYIIEIKPKKQLSKPIPPKRKTSKSEYKYLIEEAEYTKNCNKWTAADKWAKERGVTFKVWTEDTLKNLRLMAK